MSNAKQKTPKRLVLLDAHAILHRAYHALPELTTPDGSPAGALYGVSSMLLKIIAELSPQYIVACYDLPEPTYRHHAFEGYKATRTKTDDALISQIQSSRDIFTAFGIPMYDAPGFEADDILGTIVEEMRERGDVEIIIASGDMDTMQLVSGTRVRVYTLKKGIKDTILYDESAVRERFGFSPGQLIDFKGLRGDPSDNIPGVRGVGEKTASALIAEFGTIENIYRALKKDSEALLRAGVKGKLKEVIAESEEEALFSKELATIRTDAPVRFSLPERSWRDALDLSSVYALFERWGFRSLASRVRDVYGGSNVEIGEGGESEDTELALPVEDTVSEKDAFLKAHIAYWLLNSEHTNPSKDEILHYTKTTQIEKALASLERELKKLHMEKVYTDIELPLMPIIERMETRGVLIDTEALSRLKKEFGKKLATLESAIHEYAGVVFNIQSPKQLGEVLFDTLELSAKGMKKTATGQRSTRESELIKLKDIHPIINSILDYRELQKLVSTYIDAITERVGEDGRLHAEFLQTGTTTGRMASQNPNLQNLPTRTEYGREIRKAVIAPSGFRLLALDYSQIELRIAAFLSGDQKLLTLFREGGDVHTKVASEVFSTPPEQVDSEMRRRAKVINFGILYGMGVGALQQNLGTSRPEAQQFLNDYLARFPGIAEYMSRVKFEVKTRGYTETFFGRRRYFSGINSPLPYVVSQAERMAINAPIQGTQSDIIKLAMSKIDREIEARGWREKAFCILQIHDELVFEVQENVLEEVIPVFSECMERVVNPEDLSGITLTVDAEVGENWGEMKSYSLK